MAAYQRTGPRGAEPGTAGLRAASQAASHQQQPRQPADSGAGDQLDAERYTREIAYTPNFQSIFANQHLPGPGSPLSPQSLQHQHQHLDQAADLGAGCRGPTYAAPAAATNNQNANTQPQQTSSSPGCCIGQHQPVAGQQGNLQQQQPMVSRADLYQQPQSPLMGSYSPVSIATALATAAALSTLPNITTTNNNPYQPIADPYVQQQQQTTTTAVHHHQMQQQQQQQQQQQIHGTYQTGQPRFVNQPNPMGAQQSAMPRVAVFRGNPYQGQQQPMQQQMQQPMQQPLQQPVYIPPNPIMSLPGGQQQQPSGETLAQSYHQYARRPRGRPPGSGAAIRHQNQPVTLAPIQHQTPILDPNQNSQINSLNIRTHLLHHLQSQTQQQQLPTNPPMRQQPPAIHQQQASTHSQPTQIPNTSHNVYRTPNNQPITTNAPFAPTATDNNQNSELIQQMPRLNNLLSNTRFSAPTTRLPALHRSAGGNINTSVGPRLNAPADAHRVAESVRQLAQANQAAQINQTRIRYQATSAQQVEKEPSVPQTITSCTSTTVRLNGNQPEVSAYNKNTPVSVSSTTRPVSLLPKQHVGTQITPEALNKACQFDGRNSMINKALNATVSMLDQITQTEKVVEKAKPTYVDRASSPIQLQHLQHIQPLQPARMDIPVRRKVTAKRKKVESIIEEKKPELIDSDTEINILE